MPWFNPQLICATLLVLGVNSQRERTNGNEFSCSRKVDGDYPYSVHSCRTDFVSCSNSITYRQNCPTGLYYDPTNRICDRKQHIVQCGGEVPTRGPIDDSTTTTAVPINFECPSPNGRFPHPTILCSPVYFECSNSRAQQWQCSAGELFDAPTVSCQPQAAVGGCSFDCSDRSNGMYAMGCSQMFWWCWETVTSKQACVTGLYFDEPYGECTYKKWLGACGCARPITTTPSTQAPHDATTAITPSRSADLRWPSQHSKHLRPNSRTHAVSRWVVRVLSSPTPTGFDCLHIRPCRHQTSERQPQA
jgi:hypothetical protein